MPMNPNFEEIGTQFVKHYYTQFDVKETRQQVSALYHPSEALLTFEGSQFQGVGPIMEKLLSIPLESLQRVITKADCQPTDDNGVIMMVVGQLKNNSENDKPMGFSQVFYLKPAQNTYYIYHEMFRLAIHDV